MAKTPFTHSLTPEQKAQQLKAREHSLGSADDRQPAETNIAWEIQLKPQPMPESETEPGSAPHAPADESIAPASRQEQAPTVPGSSARPAEQPLSPAGTSTSPLPAEGYIQAPDDPALAVPLVSSPPGPIARHSVRLDSSDQHPSAHATGGGAAGGKASAAASHADPAAVTATHGIDGGATASNASPVATPPGSTTTPGGATTPPATFQAQGSTSGQVKEDLQLHTQGALTISGQPSGPVQWDVASRQGLLGTLDIDQHGQWRYLLDNTNPRVQALGEGQQVTERFLVFATDASGTTRAVHVLVEVNGNNDRAVIAGATLGSVTEDAQWHTGGKLSVTDADSGQAEFIPMSVAQGAHGTFTVAPDGTWTYTLDNAQPAVQALRDGDQLTDTIAVSSKDGTTQQITVTINGHDDQALIAGTAIGTVKEDDQPSTGGKLTVTDPDAHQAEFVPMSAGQGAHGTFTLAPDGTWTYTLDNAQPAVQALRSGDQLTDTITVSSKDGTTQTLTVYVNGTNDAPSLRAISQHATEDGTAIHGQLSGSDADSGDILAYGCPQQTPGFTLNVDGSYSFDPSNAAYQHLAEGEQLVLQIPVTVTDQAGARATQTLQITVTGSNDQPVLALTPLSAHEGDVTLSGQLVAADIDAGDRQTFSSSTPVAGFMLNADGSYSFNPADPAYDHLKAGEQLTLDIPVTVTDSQGAQDTQHLLLTLTGTNDAPTLVVISVGTKEDAPVVRGQLTSIDADSGDILAYGCPQQTPGFALSVDGSYSFDPSNAAYQYLAEGEQLVLQIPVTVTDQAGARDTQTLQITVTGTNDLPLMQLIPPAATFEGSPVLQGHLLAIDMDVHDTLSYRATAPVAGFALASDGSWTFDPADPAYNHLAFGQKQIVTLPVEVVDSAGGIVASQIQITVTGTNDAPTLAIQPARHVGEGAAAVHGQLTATDPDTGDTLTYSVGQHIAGFTLNADGSYVFDPADPHYNYLPAGQQAVITVPVFVTDAHGLSDTQQIQITVTGTNDVPIVGGIDHAMGAVGGTPGGHLRVQGQLTAIDLDAGESHFQGQLIPGTHGVLEIKADGSWTYSADATRPALAQMPANGQLSEHFTVHTADGTSHDIDITLKGSNMPAIFAGISNGMVSEDQTGSISHHLSVTDPNAGESAFHPVDRDAHYGHFTLSATGDWTYTLDNSNAAVQGLVTGKTLTDSIVVGSIDGTPTVITVTIMGADDRALISGTHTGSVIEDNTGSGTTLAASGQLAVADPDAGQDHFLAMQNIAGDHGFGTFSIDAQGHWTYSADNSQASIQALKAGETATDSVTVMSADGTRQTVTVTLHGTQDRAVIAGAATGAVTEDQGVSAAGKLSTGGTLTVTDVDSGEAHFVAQTDVAGGNGYGSFSIDASGHWTYTADNSQAAVQGLKAGAQLTDTLTVSTADGTTHTLSVTLTGTNDAPVLQAQTQSVTEDGATLSGQMHATDADARDTLSFSLPNPVAGFTLNADGSYSFDPKDAAYQHIAAGQTEDVTIAVRVTDAAGATSTQNLVITVTGTQDGASVSGTSTGTLSEDQSVSAAGKLSTSGTLAVTDVDSGEAHFVAQTDVAGGNGYGTFSIDASGHWTYTADNSQKAIQDLNTGQHLTDTLTVHTADGTAQTLTITINGLDDHVTIAGDVRGGVTEDSATDGSFLGRLTTSGGSAANAGDFGDHVVAGQFGSFDIRNDGRWIYTLDNSKAAVQALAAGETVQDKITVSTRDGTTQELTVTVTGTHDLPTISAHGAAQDHSITGVTQVLHPTGAADLSAFATQDAGMPAGTRLLALYAPGSDVNVLDGIPEAQRPTIGTTGYSAVSGVHGYQFLNTNGWFGANVHVAGYDFAPQAPSVRNTWDGGVAVFSDGTVVQVVKVCNGNGSEKDYIYFAKYQGIAASTGGSVVAGEAAAGATVDVYAGTQRLGSATADSNGHWELGVARLPDGTQSLHTVINGQAQPEHLFGISGASATERPGGLLLGSLKEDAVTDHLTGTLDVTDIDATDNPQFTVQGGTAGQYGTFAIDAQGHWTYTLDNSKPETTALTTGDSRTETFHVEVTTRTGEHVTREVTVNVTGNNDAPTVTAVDTAHAADLGATTEDNVHTFTQADLLKLVGASDVDTGDSLSISAVSVDAQYGAFSKQPNGDWTFTPAANAHHDDIPLTLTVSDGHGITQAHGTLDLESRVDAAQVGLQISAEQQVMDFGASGNPQAYARVPQVHAGQAMTGATAEVTFVLDQAHPPSNDAVFLNYSVPGGTSATKNLITLWDAHDLHVSILGANTGTGVNLLDGQTHRITISWDGTSGELYVYDNGHEIAHQSNVAQGQTLPDGGTFLLATRTDTNSGPDNPADYKAVYSAGGRIFAATLVDHPVDAAAIGNAPISQESHGVLASIQATPSGYIDAASGQPAETGAGISTVTVPVDVSAGAIPEGATLYIHPTANPVGGDQVSAIALTGLMAGTVLSDGAGHTVTVTGADQHIDITGWTLGSITARLPAGGHDNMNLQVIATSTDGEGHQTTASAFQGLMLDPSQPIPDAVIAGADAGSGDEDAAAITGTLTITDADASQAHFIVQTDTDGHYGKFSLGTDGHWSYTPDNRADALAQGASAQEHFTVRSADGTTHQVTITLAGTTDAPTITGTLTGAVTEDDAAKATASGSLSAADARSGDTAMIVAQSAYQGSYGTFSIGTDGHWVYTLDNSDAATQALGAGQSATETIIVSATAADGSTVHQSLTITVTGSNDGPVLGPITAQNVAEDGAALHGQLQATDADHDTLTYSTQATVDGFTLNTDGSWSFDPTHASYQSLGMGVVKDITIPVSVADGHGGTSSQDLVIHVTGTNDAPIIGTGVAAVAAPVASGQEISQDGFATLMKGLMTAGDRYTQIANVVAHELGWPGLHPVASIHIGRDPSIVSEGLDKYVLTDADIVLTGPNGQQRVLPASGVSTGDTSTVQVRTLVEWLKQGSDYHVEFRQAPGAHSTIEFHDRAVSDAGMGNIEFTQPGRLASGTARVDVDAFTDLHSLPLGSLGFHPEGGAAAATPAAPAEVSSGAVTEDSAPTLTGTLHAHDIDAGDVLTFSVQGGGHGIWGDATVDPQTGEWHYTLNAHAQTLGAGETAQEVVTIVVTDKAGATVTQAITLTITGTEDASVITGDHAGSVTEDGTGAAATAQGVVSISDVDRDDTAAFVAKDASAPYHGSYGTLTLDAGGHWTYTLDSSHAQVQAANVRSSLTDTVWVESSDGSSYAIRIAIQGTDDAPTLSQEAVLKSTPADTARTYPVSYLTSYGQDVDNNAQTDLSALHLQVDPAQGTVVLNGDGTFTFTPAHGFTGMVELHYDLTDKDGASTPVVAHIGVATGYSNALNTAPDSSGPVDLGIAPLDHTVEIRPEQLLATSHDIDGDPLSLHDLTVNVGTLQGPDIAGHYLYTPQPGYQGKVEFSYQVTDKPGTTTDDVAVHATLEMVPSNAQIGGADQATTPDDDTAVSGVLTVTDADAGQDHFIAQTDVNGQYGKFSIGANGHWTYTPDDRADALAVGASTQEYFTVRSADGTSHQISVTLTGTADAPIISGDQTQSTVEDAAAAVSGSLAATLAGSSQTVDFAASTQHGIYGDFTVDASGRWHYVIDNGKGVTQGLRAGQSETETFTVSATSSDGTITQQKIFVTVEGRGDAPVLQAQTQSVTEDGSLLRGQMQATDTDAGDTLKFTTSSTAGGFTLNADGSYSFDPSHADYQNLAVGETRDVVIPITVTDGSGATSVQSLTITVTGTNDAPVIGAATTGSTTALAVAVGHQMTLDDHPLAIIGEALIGGGHPVLGHVLKEMDGGDSFGAVMLARDSQQVWPAKFVITEADLVFTKTDGTPPVVTLPGTPAGGTSQVTLGDLHNYLKQGYILHFDMAEGTNPGFRLSDFADTTQRILSYPGAGSVTDAAYDDHWSNYDFQSGAFRLQTGAPASGTAPLQEGEVQEDLAETVSGQLTAHDIDSGDTLSFAISGAAHGQYGDLSIDATTGAWTYRLHHGAQALAEGATEHESFTVAIRDNHGGETTQTVTLTIKGSNDLPTVTGTTATPAVLDATAEDTPHDYTEAELLKLIGAADTDTGDTLAISSVAVDPQYGAFAKQPDGTWRFTPAANVSHDDIAVTLTVSDGHGTRVAHGTLDITGVADTPTLSVEASTAAGHTTLASADFSQATQTIFFDPTSQDFQAPAQGVTSGYYDVTTAKGGSADDIFRFSALKDGASYTVDGGSGRNVLDLSAYNADDVLIDSHAGTATVSLPGGGAAVVHYTNFAEVRFSSTPHDGTPHAVEAVNGQWTFAGTQMSVAGGTAKQVALVDYAGALQSDYTLAATVNAHAHSGFNTTGGIVFDYQDANNFKMAVLRAGQGGWNIEEYHNGQWVEHTRVHDASMATPDVDHDVELRVHGSVAELWSGGVMKTSHDFGTPLNGGRFGVVSDGGETSFQLAMHPTDWAPSAPDVDARMDVTDTELVTQNVLDQAVDPEGHAVTLSHFDATSAHGGTVTSNGDGTFRYVPAAGFSGSDSFTYEVTDGVNHTTATIRVNVVDLNTVHHVQPGDPYSLNIQATSPDADEHLEVRLSDLPVGAVVTDGIHTATAEAGKPVSIDGWALDKVTVTPPAGQTGNYIVHVETRSTDGVSESPWVGKDVRIELQPGQPFPAAGTPASHDLPTDTSDPDSGIVVHLGLAPAPVPGEQVDVQQMVLDEDQQIQGQLTGMEKPETGAVPPPPPPSIESESDAPATPPDADVVDLGAPPPPPPPSLDGDAGRTVTPVVVVGNYGLFAIDGTGKWTYTPDARAEALNEGELAQDVFTVELADGTTHEMVLTITGSNDAPHIAPPLPPPAAPVLEPEFDATPPAEPGFAEIVVPPLEEAAAAPPPAPQLTPQSEPQPSVATGQTPIAGEQGQIAGGGTSGHGHGHGLALGHDANHSNGWQDHQGNHGHDSGHGSGHGADRDDGASLIDTPVEEVTLDFGADAEGTPPPPPPPADDTLQDYLQFADTSGHIDPGLAMHSNMLSPVDDYLHAAGVSPDAMVAPHLDLPPTEALIALASAADQGGGSHETGSDPDANLIEATDAVTHPADDPNHHDT